MPSCANIVNVSVNRYCPASMLTLTFSSHSYATDSKIILCKPIVLAGIVNSKLGQLVSYSVHVVKLDKTSAYVLSMCTGGGDGSAGGGERFGGGDAAGVCSVALSHTSPTCNTTWLVVSHSSEAHNSTCILSSF